MGHLTQQQHLEHLVRQEALVRQEVLDHLGAREALVHLEALALLVQLDLRDRTEVLEAQLSNTILVRQVQMVIRGQEKSGLITQQLKELLRIFLYKKRIWMEQTLRLI